MIVNGAFATCEGENVLCVLLQDFHTEKKIPPDFETGADNPAFADDELASKDVTITKL